MNGVSMHFLKSFLTMFPFWQFSYSSLPISHRRIDLKLLGKSAVVWYEIQHGRHVSTNSTYIALLNLSVRRNETIHTNKPTYDINMNNQRIEFDITYRSSSFETFNLRSRKPELDRECQIQRSRPNWKGAGNYCFR